MVNIQNSVFVSVIAIHAASMVDPAIAFTASTHSCPTRHFGSHASQTRCPPSTTTLRLHPDQALELEAAATELLKVQVENGEDAGTAMEELIDDTNNTPSSSMSAASSSASQPARQWWSSTFFSVVRRHGQTN
jgi:hypothetical protein